MWDCDLEDDVSFFMFTICFYCSQVVPKSVIMGFKVQEKDDVDNISADIVVWFAVSCFVLSTHDTLTPVSERLKAWTGPWWVKRVDLTYVFIRSQKVEPVKQN